MKRIFFTCHVNTIVEECYYLDCDDDEVRDVQQMMQDDLYEVMATYAPTMCDSDQIDITGMTVINSTVENIDEH